MNELLRRRIEQSAGVVAIALLLFACLLVLKPFIGSILWAVVLTYASWPVYRRLLAMTGGRNTRAAGWMTLLLTLGLILPLVLLVAGLADQVTAVVAQVKDLLAKGLPGPPAWLAGLPGVGASLDARWREWSADSANLLADIKTFLESPDLQRWMIETGRALGVGALNLALSVIVCFFFYRDGVAATANFHKVAERLIGDSAQRLIVAAAGTVDRVVNGILGTALVQGLLATIGLWVSGVPGPMFLGLVTFILSLVPMGPPLVWIPASIWLYTNVGPGWAIFMALWGLVVISGIDNIVKPYLISRGGDLPIILVLMGVLGGVLAFGFIGLFLGPVFLAVAWSLVAEWIQTRRETQAPC